MRRSAAIAARSKVSTENREMARKRCALPASYTGWEPDWGGDTGSSSAVAVRTSGEGSGAGDGRRVERCRPSLSCLPFNCLKSAV